jgi:5,10-methylenetetrahydrofolate reductase
MSKSLKHLSFAEKIKKKEKAILYELLPPPKHLSQADLDRSFSLFSAMLKNFPVSAINIPEVREEKRHGSRTDAEIIKLEPRKVASYLQKYGISDIVVNRPIVYESWEKQKQWLKDTYNSYGIRNIVLVGGESSQTSYPGISVTDAAVTIHKKLQSEFPDILLGGIIIPTRNNEAQRVLKKSQAGIEFFTSQIIYEAESVKKFLKEYEELCRQQQIKPKTIFLSFAPITMTRDAQLLKWLGVKIPDETLTVLTTGWLGMGWRSMHICQDILEDILHFVQEHDITVPLGLNIEHVNRHNFETSFVLLERLAETYLGIHSEERQYKIV